MLIHALMVRHGPPYKVLDGKNIQANTSTVSILEKVIK